MARKRPLSILDTSIAYEAVGLDMALAAFNSDLKEPYLIDRIAYDKLYELGIPYPIQQIKQDHPSIL